MNQYESQAMREILLKAGFRESSREESAGVFIINTCTVTHQADREARYFIAQFHRLNPKARIIVTGCYAENDSDEIMALPGVSGVISNAHKGRIADILQGGGTFGESYRLKVTDFKDRVKAFVKIQDGCDNFCAYCKVPLVRSRLDSKPISDIVDEVRALAKRGFKEMVLTGICLGAWGKDLKDGKDPGLVDVLKALDGLKGDFRIRISSIEPKYVDGRLIRFMSRSRKVCRHLHIPLQSGDDAILRKMNRPYTSGKYLSIINKAKAGIRGVAITTDILIGFPGETDKNFNNTLRLVKRIMPLRTHIFTYSPRKGTVAYDMDGCPARGVLKKRYLKLKTLAISTSYIYRKKFLGRRLNVLAETRRDRLTGMLTGYSDNYMKVVMPGPDALMAKMVPVKVDYINLMYTMGKRCKTKRR